MMMAEVLPFQRKQVATHTGPKVPQVVYVVVEQSASVNTFTLNVRSVHRTLEGAKKAALFWLDTKIVKMELED